MAKVKDSIKVGLTPAQAWEHALDLSRFGDWLVIHDGWRSELPGPGEIGKGTEVSSVVAAKGTRVRFNWVVDEYDPPRRVSLKGDGKGGVKVTLILEVAPDGDGADLTFELELGGLPMIGLAGRAAAKVVKGDIHTSLQKFHDLYA
ncbi:MAG: SRPBCC family protein [Gordonia sp.]|jgi:hypothetical protein|uniref:SRPBCC family protein n=1 Tax=Gordonia rubripertincta TaxID=36822 RepID=A0ABT4MZE7_GORRU|nr:MULTISPECIES: SRPBCC family protein [Mycobacteriales]MBA4021509.1 SRPBCC family protein [Gordonia sp. (in: high G+C Gram-positive bacteria)]MCZ4552389.1 SRPBCC family protein [Gordonia rubripertincta]OZG26503.1 toxin [Williamsia sp. 1138]